MIGRKFIPRNISVKDSITTIVEFGGHIEYAGTTF